MDRIREFLEFAGKREAKVIAVFGLSPVPCHRAVEHVRAGAPEIPIWLFTTSEPLPETAALCRRIVVASHPLELFCTAQKELWPHWVALAVSTWTGERGGWSIKLAPLLVPPFRALFLNANGDFFAGEPAAIWRHTSRRLRDIAYSAANRLRDLHRGAWLWLATRIAGACLHLLRSLFVRVPGRSSWPEVLPPREGTGVAEFHDDQRHWNWQELDRLVRTTSARWILFTTGGGTSNNSFEFLLEADPQGFAASHQSSFRAWRNGIAAMAPFRPLAPGEASRTLAPVSDLMLVDRARLAALGIPRTVVPGAAWLLLFWKAAAAGLHSYSVGDSAAPAEQADWPLEEAEFILRRLAHPALRKLAPNQPELARGNIAFRAEVPAARPSGQRPCVLLLSPYLPWPLSHGGAVRIYQLCRTLAGQVDFLLVALREAGDLVDYDRLHEVFRRVWIVDRDEPPLSEPALPNQVREHASSSLRALLAQIASEEPVEILQVEYTHMAAFRDALPEIPAILVEHDLTFALYRQFAELERTEAAQSEYRRWLAFERRWLGKYDALWTMSPEDRAEAIRNGSRAESTSVVPNGVAPARLFPEDSATEYAEVLYVGSFRHRPNVLGFRNLMESIMPRVWERFPQTRLRVVAGLHPERYCGDLRKIDERVLLHAFVEDLQPLYARAAVVAAPLPVSAGTNIKVIEAMACGRPVVSTPLGCAGLDLEDGCDALIREGPVAFAEAICELLAAPERRAAIGARARCTAMKRFTWQRVAEQAMASYQSLIGVRTR